MLFGSCIRNRKDWRPKNQIVCGQRLNFSRTLAERLVADATDALPLLAFNMSHLHHEFSGPYVAESLSFGISNMTPMWSTVSAAFVDDTDRFATDDRTAECALLGSNYHSDANGLVTFVSRVRARTRAAEGSLAALIYTTRPPRDS